MLSYSFHMNFPDFLVVFLMGMLPITELQGAIIYGVTVLNMNPWLAFISGTAGSITISILLLASLKIVTEFLSKQSKLFARFFKWLFARTQAKHSVRLSEIGHFALFTYIAIPTPGSGAWSGSLIAHVFGIPRKKAAFILISGLTVTGLIVMLGTEGVLFLVQAKNL